MTLVVLYPIFFCSGAAALIFETLWFRGAGLTFGNSVWASAITLAAYMAGLALGNAWAARMNSWAARPVLTYAFLEVLIAGSGLMLVALFPLLPELLAPRLGLMAESPGWSSLMRLGTVFLLLVVPTTAMGATLPLLVKALCDRNVAFGNSLGLLYGLNTLGALCGVLAGEFLLIERFGLLGAGVCAASLNLLAAALAGWIGRTSSVPAVRPVSSARNIDGRVMLLVAAGFFAGAALMGAEVLWFRFLRLFFLDTEATFAVMLAVVLAGIGLGGLLGAALLRRFPGSGSLPLLAAAACGAALVLSYGVFDARLVGSGWHIGQDAITLLSMVLMFPAALASGVLFTVLGASLHAVLHSELRATALLTTANTTGAMTSALLAGFVLLPNIGVERSLWVMAGLYGALLLCLFAALRSQLPQMRGAAAAALAVLALALIAFPAGRMQAHLDLASEKFRLSNGSHTVAISEGVTETLQYLQTDWQGVPVAHELMTNGFSMTDSSTGARRYMSLYAYWPAALHATLDSALLISYGMGNTAKSLTQLPSLSRIDIVDISENILRHADVPYPGSENPLADPRVRGMVDDGRYYLQATAKRYDLITSEPPPPRAPGVVSLYTEEYFRLIRARLNAGGLATYWLPVHNMTAADAKAILKAFCNAFPDCSLWGGYEHNWMMVGSRDMRPASAEHFSAPWRDPVLRRAFSVVGLEREELLGASFMADAAQLQGLLGDVPPLTDNHPKRYSQAAPGDADLRLYADWMNVVRCRERFRQSDWIARHWPAEWRMASVPFFALQPAMNDLAAIHAAGQTLQMLNEVLKVPGLETPVLWLLRSQPREVEIAHQLSARGTLYDVAAVDYVLGAEALAQGATSQAADRFAAALTAGNARALAPFLFAACRSGQSERAREIAMRFAPGPIHNSLARCWR